MQADQAPAGVIPFVWRNKRLLGVGLFVVVVLTVLQVSGLREHFNLAFIRELIQQHWIGGLVLFVLLFALGNLILIPGWVFLAAAVVTLGRGPGGVVTYVAAVISCAITFVAIRALGGDALRLLTNRVAVRILRELDAHPIASIASLRILFQTNPALNYALAMSGIRFRTYLIGTVVGLPLPIALYCIFFDILATGLHVN
ncbi:MAG: VTT domain-containing protein [Casimicrobiaceae bacterium]